MASSINSTNIKIMRSQTLLDTDDGGGQMTANEVIDGKSNNLFPDTSELDRAYGRINMRKVFMSVQTSDTDSLLGSNVIIADVPQDDKVSVTLFTTKNWFDRRDAARDHVERYMARSVVWAGHLLEKQLVGQRAIQLAMREQDDIPKVDQCLCLVENEGKAGEFEQYVRVAKVSTETRVFSVGNGDVSRKVVTVEITDPLRYTFTGVSVREYESGKTPPAICRDTAVADAASYYGASKLANAAKMNDASVQVKSPFTQLVPSAQSETPLVDLNAASASSLYVLGNDGLVTHRTNASISASSKFFIGNAVYPGTLTLSAGSNTITDDAGVLRLGATEIGLIEYDKGLLSFNSSAPSYSGSISYTFKPAAAPTRVADTAAISIVQDARGYNYTINLNPIPQPASLSVSYMAQGKVYYLYDKGNGQLKGTDNAYGTGSVDYTTGSVIVTTGALPDAGSEIIFAWGKAVTAFTRANLPVSPSKIAIKLKNGQVAPGTVNIAWTVNEKAKSATDNAGKITGDATGKINYASGEIELIPNQLYAKGTEFNITYQFGEPHEHQFDMPSRDIGGLVSVVLPDKGGNIVPRSVELIWNVDIYDGELLGKLFDKQWFDPPPPMLPKDPKVQAFDNGSGGVVRADGGNQENSTIDYTTRKITLRPDFHVSIPKPVWGAMPIGEVETAKMYGGSVPAGAMSTPFRWQLAGWQNVPTLASMPTGETGYLQVKWRTDAAGQSAKETYVANQIRFDITPGFGEDIVQGSVRFLLGGRVYSDRLGYVFHSIDPATGAGVQAGQIQYQSGVVTLDDYPQGAENRLTLQSLVTEMNIQPVDEVVFRIPIRPVRSNSVQIRAVPIEGNNGENFSVTADSTGRINSKWAVGSVDYQSGVVRMRFGQVVAVTEEVRKQPWFNESAIFTESNTQKIFKPRPVYADTIRYNAVSYTNLPLSADILGLDPVRLPSDGKVPIFRVGDVVVIHNTQRYQLSAPTAGKLYNLGRERISVVKIVDSEGKPLDTTMYSADLDAGTVSLNSNFSVDSLKEPLFAEHRIEDMALLTDVQINGMLGLNQVLTHDYPIDGTLVSGALVTGDLQARVHNLFIQNSWVDTWKDSTSDVTLVKYNDVQYPIEISNDGAQQERWALIFTNGTSFRIVGEHLGQIGTGNINEDCAPLNPITKKPYFRIPQGGWGSGWASGNTLRFNTAAANYPIWIVRTVLQGHSGVLSDKFCVMARGDVDR